MKLKTVVEGKLYRSDKPSVEDYKQLNGFRVINLQVHDGWEACVSNTCRCEYIHMPMSGLFPPSDRKVDSVLKLITESEKPVLVHCLKGKDRTGLIIALYRIFHQGWKVNDAYDEMIANNFNTMLYGLYWYFKKRTRFRPTNH